jgi:hypothetical protein
MGFGSLQRLRNRRSACRGRSPARHVPPSGFGYPLDGLLPSRPCQSCFVPAALLGLTLRSFLLSQGNRPISVRLNPHTVSLVCIPSHTRCRGRLDKPRFLGFDPWRESLATDVCLAHRLLVAPLGFSLPGPLAEALTGISPSLLSRACSAGLAPSPPAPQSIDELLRHLIRPLPDCSEFG